jgi:hypothetical protein
MSTDIEFVDGRMELYLSEVEGDYRDPVSLSAWPSQHNPDTQFYLCCHDGVLNRGQAALLVEVLQHWLNSALKEPQKA